MNEIMDTTNNSSFNKSDVNYYIFWGGEDISPHLYNHPINPRCGWQDPQRDKEEIKLAKELIADGVPLIGICRGAQLLNVVNGGTLVQHIEYHGRPHIMQTPDGDMQVNSTHHQMMVPTDKGIILGTGGPSMGTTDPKSINLFPINKVTEVVYYPETKCFCIQFHPEWMSETSEAVIWAKKKIKELLNIDVSFKSNSLYYGRI